MTYLVLTNKSLDYNPWTCYCFDVCGNNCNTYCFTACAGNTCMFADSVRQYNK